MEIFNANNIASQANAAQRRQEDKRAQRVREGDRAERFRAYLDEADLDAEVERVEASEVIHPVAANDQESAREDREQHGYYSPDAGENPAERSRLDLEG